MTTNRCASACTALLGLPEIECGNEEVYSFVEYVLGVYYAKICMLKYGLM